MDIDFGDCLLKINQKGLKLKGIDVRDIALVAYFEVDGELAARDLIGGCMKKIIGCTDQVGLSVPCFALVQVSSENNFTYKELIEASGDQNWHRGDFALIVVDAEEVEKTAEKIVSSISYDGLESKFEPLEAKTYARKIKEELSARPDESKYKKELLNIISSVIEQKDSDMSNKLDNEITLWVDNILEDVKNQYYGSER